MMCAKWIFDVNTEQASCDSCRRRVKAEMSRLMVVDIMRVAGWGGGGVVGPGGVLPGAGQGLGAVSRLARHLIMILRPSVYEKSCSPMTQASSRIVVCLGPEVSDVGPGLDVHLVRHRGFCEFSH
jgi:hypothetical protein